MLLMCVFPCRCDLNTIEIAGNLVKQKAAAGNVHSLPFTDVKGKTKQVISECTKKNTRLDEGLHSCETRQEMNT
jgi:hypothetical protein